MQINLKLKCKNLSSQSFNLAYLVVKISLIILVILLILIWIVVDIVNPISRGQGFRRTCHVKRLLMPLNQMWLIFVKINLRLIKRFWIIKRLEKILLQKSSLLPLKRFNNWHHKITVRAYLLLNLSLEVVMLEEGDFLPLINLIKTIHKITGILNSNKTIFTPRCLKTPVNFKKSFIFKGFGDSTRSIKNLLQHIIPSNWKLAVIMLRRKIFSLKGRKALTNN